MVDPMAVGRGFSCTVGRGFSRAAIQGLRDGDGGEPFPDTFRTGKNQARRESIARNCLRKKAQ